MPRKPKRPRQPLSPAKGKDDGAVSKSSNTSPRQPNTKRACRRSRSRSPTPEHDTLSGNDEPRPGSDDDPRSDDGPRSDNDDEPRSDDDDDVSQRSSSSAHMSKTRKIFLDRYGQDTPQDALSKSAYTLELYSMRCLHHIHSENADEVALTALSTFPVPCTCQG